MNNYPYQKFPSDGKTTLTFVGGAMLLKPYLGINHYRLAKWKKCKHCLKKEKKIVEHMLHYNIKAEYLTVLLRHGEGHS